MQKSAALPHSEENEKVILGILEAYPASLQKEWEQFIEHLSNRDEKTSMERGWHALVRAKDQIQGVYPACVKACLVGLERVKSSILIDLLMGKAAVAPTDTWDNNSRFHFYILVASGAITSLNNQLKKEHLDAIQALLNQAKKCTAQSPALLQHSKGSRSYSSECSVW